MKNLISFSVLAFLLLGISYLAIAQVPPSGSPTNGPIDGGVFTVIGAGMAYGAKKLYDKNKQKKQL
jgi:hypothetical protein